MKFGKEISEMGNHQVFQGRSVDEEKFMIHNPLISIITPVLNRVKYVDECNQSVLSQSYPYIEHIFIDGGSVDGTLETLQRYKDKYPNKIGYISESDKGSGEAINKGLRMAKGEMFGILCSDDIYEPDAVMTIVEFFKSNPNSYFVYGGLNYINEKGEWFSKHRAKDLDLKELINDWCAIPTPAAFFKRKVVERIGWFDTLGNDLDYWIRVAKVFKVYRIDNVLANFRVHKDSATASKNYKMWKREDCIVSLRHGASIFSPRSRRYYKLLIIDWLKSILGPAYPFIKRLLKRLK